MKNITDSKWRHASPTRVAAVHIFQGHLCSSFLRSVHPFLLNCCALSLLVLSSFLVVFSHALVGLQFCFELLTSCVFISPPQGPFLLAHPLSWFGSCICFIFVVVLTDLAFVLFVLVIFYCRWCLGLTTIADSRLVSRFMSSVATL